MNERTFVPSRPSKTSVAKWVWRKSKGLTCVYNDGLSCKSAWTLPELLKAGHKDGDGLPAIEITKYKINIMRVPWPNILQHDNLSTACKM